MKLFIGVCNSQESVPAAFHWSWEAIEKSYEYDKRRFDDDDAIVRNNKMIRDFLRSDSDILVKMDIDQVYPKYYFTTMVPLAEKYKVIGPLIFNKHRKNGYCPLLSDTNDFPLIRYKEDWLEHAAKKGIIKVAFAHTNLFYMKEALEGIKPPWYNVAYSRDNCAHRMNRDFSFIEKLNANGYDTYINTNLEVGHLVKEPVARLTYNKWKK